MPPSSYTPSNSTRGMTMAKAKMKNKLPPDMKDEGAEMMEEPKPMDPMAKSEGAEEMGLEDINDKIEEIQGKLASLRPGSNLKKKRALRADLEYYTDQALRMSNMDEDSEDEAPDMRAFDPMRPMGMR